MKTITMQDILKRTTPEATFFIQNENVRFELEPNSYSISANYINMEFLNKDIREIFKPYLEQKFCIHEISETGEFFYSNMRMCNPQFCSSVFSDGTTQVFSSLSFIEEKVK